MLADRGRVGRGEMGRWGRWEKGRKGFGEKRGEKGVGSRVNGERGATGPRGEEVGEKTREGAQEEEGTR